MSLPFVAIIGRPNVGKSTLFNRIIGRSLAVVDDLPGITRDRNVATVDWAGSSFHLVDTGGWVPEGMDGMERRILDQVLRALDDCDLVLFVVDAQAGLEPHDWEIARRLMERGAPCLLVANKVDADRWEGDVGEFARLGFDGTPIGISAQVGRNVGDLLDLIIARIPRHDPGDAEDGIRIAVLGRPNVGKSSIVNRLLGEERMIVDDVAGTTRDAIDAPFRYHGRGMVLVDTAGIRRKLEAQPDFAHAANLVVQRDIVRENIQVIAGSRTAGQHQFGGGEFGADIYALGAQPGPNGIQRHQPIKQFVILAARHGARQRLVHVMMRIDQPRQHHVAGQVKHFVGGLRQG